MKKFHKDHSMFTETPSDYNKDYALELFLRDRESDTKHILKSLYKWKNIISQKHFLLACKYQSVPIIHAILKLNPSINVNGRDNDGMPFLMACKFNSETVIMFLLNNDCEQSYLSNKRLIDRMLEKSDVKKEIEKWINSHHILKCKETQ